MTPARAIQQSPSSFLEDSSTSSMDSSPLEAELERERRRYREERELCYRGFFVVTVNVGGYKSVNKCNNCIISLRI